jgi:hypothetical protein
VGRFGIFRATVAVTTVLAGAPALADAELDGARARWESAALSRYEYGYHKY